MSNDINNGKSIILANRIREVFLNGHWIANTNYKAQIETLSWRDAVHTTATLNSIAALVFHINYYLDGILNAFEKGKLDIHDSLSFDMPPVISEEHWKQLSNTLLNNATRFADYVEQMQDERLDQPFFDIKYGTVLRNLEGVIEHSYYHLGQISLIRKLLANKQG